MSLDTWLQAKTKSEKPKEKSEDDSWNPALINKPQQRRILGILGGHKRSDYHDFQKTIINDILVKMGSAPDLVLLSDEGKDTSWSSVMLARILIRRKARGSMPRGVVIPAASAVARPLFARKNICNSGTWAAFCQELFLAA